MSLHRQLSIGGGFRHLPTSILLLASSLLAPSSHAQSTLVDPSKLPACGVSCAKLTQAQAACQPPSAPNPKTCFCESAYLKPLLTSPNGVCDAECATSPNDVKKIQQWYIGLCKNAGAASPAGNTGGNSGSSGSSSNSNSGDDSGGTDRGTVIEPPQGSWIQHHWPWLVFIVIVILLVIGLIFLLRWIKRRRAARHAARVGNVGGGNSYHSNMASEQGLGGSQSQMAESHTPTSRSVLSTPTPARQLTRQFGNRPSFTASRDSLPTTAAAGLVGRSRSNSRPDSRVSSPVPVAWGPHQYQAHSRGFSGDDVPPPIPQTANRSSSLRNSWGPQSPAASLPPGKLASTRSQEMLREEDEDDVRPHTAGGHPTSPRVSADVRRKLSKKSRRQ